MAALRSLSSNDLVDDIPMEKHVVGDGARGIKNLDKSLFNCSVKAIGITVSVKNVALFKKSFKNSIFKITNVNPVVKLGKETGKDPKSIESSRVILIDPNIYSSPDEFTSKHLSQLNKLNVDLTSCNYYSISLDYTNWNYDEILKWILPLKGVDGIGGFSIIGHIAHLNLKDDLLDYKSVIGQVILDKVSAVRTVVNKLQTIDNTFRNFKMELLAGDEDYKTMMKEHGVTYEFDFSKVYWNPRLATEHQRIVEYLKPGDLVFDVFAGVGPFVIPAAKRGCLVYANDLNPDSFHWLKRNMNINKICPEKFNVYNLDGREFIGTILKDVILKEKILIEENDSSSANDSSSSGSNRGYIHVVMNLPALATEFLDAFKGLTVGLSPLQVLKPDPINKEVNFFGTATTATSTATFAAAADNNNDDSSNNNNNSNPHTPTASMTTATTTSESVINLTSPTAAFNKGKNNNNSNNSNNNNYDNNIDNNNYYMASHINSNIIIHCYSFSKAVDPEGDVITRVKQSLDLDLLTFFKSGVRRVRNVAPNKEMMCVSFYLPLHVLFSRDGDDDCSRQDRHQDQRHQDNHHHRDDNKTDPISPPEKRIKL